VVADGGHPRRRDADRASVVSALALLSLVLAGALAACAEGPAPLYPPAPDPLSLRYTCGTFPFGPEILAAGPGHDEDGASPQAAALRLYLASPVRVQHRVPATGWRLLGSDDRRAEFGATNGQGMWVVVVRNAGALWVANTPDTCQPHLVLPAGLGPASWRIDPTTPAPTPLTQAFDALVTERACSSGEPAAGRIVGPQIVKSAEMVLVIFAVRAEDARGPRCPANPASRVTVDLGEALGARLLLDGGRLPFGDPTLPA
jgi:hypothetical protein